MDIKTLIIVVAILALLVIVIVLIGTDSADAQTQLSSGSVQLKKGWGLGVSTQIPILKICESTTDNTKLDAVPVIGFGGGLCFYYTPNKLANEHERLLSITPLMVVLSARIDGEEQLDPTIATVVGVMDDLVQLGVGYYAGTLDSDRSRWEVMFSLGMSFK